MDAESKSLVKNLGKNIKVLRETRSLTQAQLAKKAGVALETIRRIEKGADSWLKTLLKIADALEVELSVLFTPDE